MKKKWILISMALIIAIGGVTLVVKSNLFDAKEKNKEKSVTSSTNVNNIKQPRNPNALYDLYVSISGNLMYLQVDSINGSDIKYNILNEVKLKNENSLIGDLVDLKNGSVYCVMTSLRGAKSGAKVLNFDKGELKEEIALKSTVPNDLIVSDYEKEFGYISAKPATKNQYPEGVPFSIISENNNKEKDKKFYVKGMTSGYDIKDDSIYINVSSADKCEYKDVPNNYVLKVNRNTMESQIIKNKDNLSPIDLKINSKNKMYILSNGYVDNDKFVQDSSLEVYKTDGTYLNQVKLKGLASEIEIDKNDIAYISNRDKDAFWDQLGDKITIFDTKQDKIIGEIDGFKGPTNMVIKDSYLFVADTGNCSVAIISLDSKKLIGRIKLGDKKYPYKLAIVKN